MSLHRKRPSRAPRFKPVDSTFWAVVIPYFIWPWWAQHGGPPPPSDLGTFIMGVLAAYSGVKVIQNNSKSKDSDEHTD